MGIMNGNYHTERKTRHPKIDVHHGNEILAESQQHSKLPTMTPKPTNKKAIDFADNLLYPNPNSGAAQHSEGKKSALVRHKSVGRSGVHKQSVQRQIVLNEQDEKLYIELTDQLCSIQEEDSHDQAQSSTKDDSRKGTQPK
jgi:hypothetical protein